MCCRHTPFPMFALTDFPNSKTRSVAIGSSQLEHSGAHWLQTGNAPLTSPMDIDIGTKPLGVLVFCEYDRCSTLKASGSEVAPQTSHEQSSHIRCMNVFLMCWASASMETLDQF